MEGAAGKEEDLDNRVVSCAIDADSFVAKIYTEISTLLQCIPSK
jgi:hypothetical protein